MNRAQFKAQAKIQIKGKIGMLFLITLIIGLISFGAALVLSLIPFGGLISTIVITPAFALSMVNVYLTICKGQNVSVGNAFDGFKDFWSAFKVQFLVGLFTFLWSLLFIIPGIIKSYAYRMSMNVLAENPGKPALECIEESKKMTDGKKADLFILDLSFLGWMLLGVVTLGIALIWVMPYYNATFINVYNDIKPKPEFEQQELN